MPLKADLTFIERVSDKSLFEQAKHETREEFPSVVVDGNGNFLYCSKSTVNINVRRKITGLYDIIDTNGVEMASFLHRKGPFAARLSSRKYAWALISRFRGSELSSVYFVLPGADAVTEFSTLGEYLLHLSSLLELTTRFCGEDNEDCAELLAVLKTRTTRIMTLCGMSSSLIRVEAPPVIDISKFMLLLSDAARTVLGNFDVGLSYVCDRSHPAKLGAENFAKLYAAAINLMIANSADKKVRIVCEAYEEDSIRLVFSTFSAQKTGVNCFSDFLCDLCKRLGFQTFCEVTESGEFSFCAIIPEETDCDFFVRTVSIEKYLYDISEYADVFNLLLCGVDMMCL